MYVSRPVHSVSGGPESLGCGRRSDQRSRRLHRSATRGQSRDLGHEEAPAGMELIIQKKQSALIGSRLDFGLFPRSLRFALQLKQFDVGDVEGLVGRYSHTEHGIKMDGQAYLRQFYNQRSFHKRLAMIRQARKGGAVTPEAYVHLQPFILSGRVDVKTYCEVQTLY